MNIVLLATAWGPRHGGINAFNRDFAIGLAAELGGAGRVFCAVPTPTDIEVSEAGALGVELISLAAGAGATGMLDVGAAEDVVVHVRHASGAGVDRWIGHDLVSGDAALAAAASSGGAAALIHHMSYVSYQGYKHDGAEHALEKHNQQRVLFRNVAALFAVGPLLRDSCDGLSGGKATELIPGFVDARPNTAPRNSIVAITHGRMDASDDRLKQGRLAVEGFSRAARELQLDNPFVPLAMKRPRISVIGLRGGDEEAGAELKRMADEIAGYAVNLYPLPFIEDRAELLDHLSQCNLAMMLSWHEGFGLAGWEAISAEVPLIVGRHSGLFRLVSDGLGGQGTGCLRSVNVRGWRGESGSSNYVEADAQAVMHGVLEVAGDVSRAMEDAKSLKRALQSKFGCTWRHTARQFLGMAEVVQTASGKAPPPRVTTSVGAGELSVPLVDLAIGTRHGTDTSRIELLSEVQFRQVELDVGGHVLVLGVSAATLSVTASGCDIAGNGPLSEVGGRRIASRNDWPLRGPLVDRALTGAASSGELCVVRRRPGEDADISLAVFCEKHDLVVSFKDPPNSQLAVNKQKLIAILISKHLTDGRVSPTLSSARVQVEWGEQ